MQKLLYVSLWVLTLSCARFCNCIWPKDNTGQIEAIIIIRPLSGDYGEFSCIINKGPSNVPTPVQVARRLAMSAEEQRTNN